MSELSNSYNFFSVLIVVKCIVNKLWKEAHQDRVNVLIVAKCIVNTFGTAKIEVM